LAIFGKQVVNLACSTQNMKLQHHFSKTRHPSGQIKWYLFQLVIPPVEVPSKFPGCGHCTMFIMSAASSQLQSVSK